MPSAMAASWRSEPPEQMTKWSASVVSPVRSIRTMSAAFLSSASSTTARARASGESSRAGARDLRFGRPSRRGAPTAAGTGSVTYVDTELPQESCHAGRSLTFGKVSEPVVTAEQGAYASGLSPRGQLFAANKSSSRFYGPPLVAWKPALGAFQYEVQWGHKASPFVTTGELKTPTSSTSTVLPLGPGVWYYRVRGVNAFIPGAKPLMSWSDPTKLVVTRPSFRLVH